MTRKPNHPNRLDWADGTRGTVVPYPDGRAGWAVRFPATRGKVHYPAAGGPAQWLVAPRPQVYRSGVSANLREARAAVEAAHALGLPPVGSRTVMR